MRYYKECVCGTKNMFESRANTPQYCSVCDRSLLDISSIDTENPEPEDIVDVVVQEECGCCKAFFLTEVNNAFRIRLNQPECIVGRVGAGSEVLENYHSISREHITVKYRNNIGVLIEDTSRFGTYVNNVRLIKGVAQFIGIGDHVKLHEVEFILTEDSVDANK